MHGVRHTCSLAPARKYLVRASQSFDCYAMIVSGVFAYGMFSTDERPVLVRYGAGSSRVTLICSRRRAVRFLSSCHP